MSDEHAPLRLLRQVFGAAIVEVVRDDPDWGGVSLAGDTYAGLRLVEAMWVARFGATTERRAAMDEALRAAIAHRAARHRAEATRLGREADAMAALRVPACE